MKAFARDLDPPLHRLAQIDRPKDELRRMRKIVDLRDDLIEAVDLLDDDVVELLPEFGVVEALRE